MKYAPLLPVETVLFVVEGPSVASGYEWWHVVPTAFGGRDGPGHGWVAGASREGEPWMRPTDIACPARPVDLADLVALTDGLALACFSRQPITVRARLIACDCDIDGPATDPAWLGVAAQPILLVDPSRPVPADLLRNGYMLHLDPEVWTSPMPLDQVVDVTGVFDHPAAERCLVGGFDEPLKPSIGCRFAFALTGYDVVEP